MSRLTFLMTILGAMLLIQPPVDARQGPARRGKIKTSGTYKRTTPKVRIQRATRRSTITRRARLVRTSRKAVRTIPKRGPLKAKAHKSRLRTKQVRHNRRVRRISLSRLNRRDRQQVMGLMSSKRVRSSKAAQRLVAEFVRLKTTRRGKAMPLSIQDLRQMTSSTQWSSRRMANLAKVLRLARHIVRRDKVSPKKAFNKALKAAGVYKKYYSGTCGA